MPLIDIIAGARPNFMKIAPIIRALGSRPAHKKNLKYRLVHTGQHYDAKMSGDFFRQLGIPAPHINLESGSGSQADQTAAIMIRYEKLLVKKRADLCLVVGDVNSTMSCAIVAKKMGMRVAHVEGGIRSGDWTMPEEINRVVTDSITDWFFTTSETANTNLLRSGIARSRIFLVGNTMIDTLKANMARLTPPGFWGSLNLRPKEYFLLTLHRPANVDNGRKLFSLLKAVGGGARGMMVVFPVHPRTAQILKRLPKLPENIYLTSPQPYLEFNYLAKNAKAVITDSGGITEETTVMGVPCMTLRDNTERPETITIGTNLLLGTDPAALKPAYARLFAGRWKKGKIPPKWDGKAGIRIAALLKKLLNK